MCITVTSRVLLCSHCSPPRAAVSSWAPMEFTEDQSFVVAPALSLTAGRRNFPTTGLAARLTHCHRNKKGVLPGLFESLRTKSLADRKSFGAQHLGPNLGHMCLKKSSKWGIQVGQKWFPLFDKLCVHHLWLIFHCHDWFGDAHLPVGMVHRLVGHGNQLISWKSMGLPKEWSRLVVMFMDFPCLWYVSLLEGPGSLRGLGFHSYTSFGSWRRQGKTVTG